MALNIFVFCPLTVKDQIISNREFRDQRANSVDPGKNANYWPSHLDQCY